MSGRYLLDTNIAIRVLNQQIDLDAREDRTREVLLCLTVVGELHFGAAKSGRPEANRARVEALLEVCPLVAHDLQTAEGYGLLKNHLRRRDRPIPENDLWIAAASLRHNLVLVTRDHHFEGIDGLRLEAW